MAKAFFGEGFRAVFAVAFCFVCRYVAFITFESTDRKELLSRR